MPVAEIRPVAVNLLTGVIEWTSDAQGDGPDGNVIDGGTP